MVSLRDERGKTWTGAHAIPVGGWGKEAGKPSEKKVKRIRRKARQSDRPRRASFTSSGQKNKAMRKANRNGPTSGAGHGPGRTQCQ